MLFFYYLLFKKDFFNIEMLHLTHFKKYYNNHIDFKFFLIELLKSYTNMRT